MREVHLKRPRMPTNTMELLAEEQIQGLEELVFRKWKLKVMYSIFDRPGTRLYFFIYI